MSEYFSNFSLNKITSTIATAAHKTQDTLSNAISNVNLSDPQTKLTIKARTRYLQESLGAVDEISKLPPQYESLEKKADAMEKCCRRMLVVTKTFEVEGYDYPPNLTESISDWWSFGKDGWFGSSAKKADKEAKAKDKKDDMSDTFLPRSFSQALSKAANDSSSVFPGLVKPSGNGHDGTQNPGNDGNIDLDADLDDEFDDIEKMKEMFDTFAKCYKNLDENKHEMDTSIAKEFNAKLEKLLNEDFKEVRELRKKVEDSRLKFDTVLYEIKLKQKKHEEKAASSTDASKNGSPIEQNENSNEQEFKNKSAEVDQKSQVQGAKETKTETKTESSDVVDIKPGEKEADTTKEGEVQEVQSEDDKLLEQLEDEFVSNTSVAVEKMGEITDCSDLLGLLKLFQNYQLVYYRQCVAELEASLKSLTELENE